jgi:hypothetical protein
VPVDNGFLEKKSSLNDVVLGVVIVAWVLLAVAGFLAFYCCIFKFVRKMEFV